MSMEHLKSAPRLRLKKREDFFLDFGIVNACNLRVRCILDWLHENKVAEQIEQKSGHFNKRLSVIIVHKAPTKNLDGW